MIFEKHPNGPESVPVIRYKNEKDEWEELPVPDIYWVFQSEQPVSDVPADDPGCVPANEHTVSMVLSDRSLKEFTLPEVDIEALYKDLQEANPNIIFGAPASARIALPNLPNTRDLGGIRTKDGKYILPHRLIRSGELHGISHEGKKVLEKEYNLKEIVDLRTDMEILASPDPLFLGVHWTHCPIYDLKEVGEIGRGSSLRDILDDLKNHPEETMLHLYKDMVSNPFSIEHWRRFFDILLQEDKGAVLFHCTQGKDRTGMAAVLILTVLGVDKETIYEGYERTTGYLHAENEEIIHKLCEKEHEGPEAFENLKYLFIAYPKYLDVAYQTAEEKYGSMENFITEGIGVTAEEQQALKDKYLAG